MSTRQIAYAAVLAALYVVIGQFVTPYLRNPMVPGAIIAINMVVVVVAGILFGPTAGALVGFVGTLINALFSETGSRAFEFGAVIPHTLMGLAAGLIARANQPLAAFAIVVGHALNIAVFLAAGLLPLSQVAVTIFWSGLLVETVVDLVVIWILVAALRPLVRAAAA
ncbi:MAG: ECF transporter S component [Armatimonadota bacterium]|nr:ECF transporter S component [Armatimonadota bacterium]MDR7427298.1 ECF transporter S component [Armatimonadota bacterium]MDR7469920.1 ECF transporter S component [Armatimonadota bacterium]MDR7474605.1 ECF transporter S component [Armatimonadota bacterium]MDR7539848.1 ECF transporter S component [Armatimonadota bacterium]